MEKSKKSRTTLERFGLRFRKKFRLFRPPAEKPVPSKKPEKQETLERFGTVFPKSGRGRGLPISYYLRLKKRQKSIGEAIRAFRVAPRGKPPAPPVGLGRGREFAVFYYKGFNFGVAAKRQREEEAPKTFKKALKVAEAHRKAHEEFVEAGIPVPKLYATQLHLRPKVTHYVERIFPLVKVGKRRRIAPVEYVEGFIPQIVRQLRAASDKGLVIDSLIENWGVSRKTGKLVYIDTFQPPDRPSKWWKEARQVAEFKENIFRFLRSMREFYSPEEEARLRQTVLIEVEKQMSSNAEEVKKFIKEMF